jgi:hypothetical protein
MSSTLLADSGDGIYQTVGAGSYYLADGSTNQNAGESDINPALLADLQTLTTYPPVLLDEVLATNTTFSPQAPRNTGPPDLGYHYPPIDYAISIAISNASVTVLPGTVLAGCGEGYAVWLYTNATFNCQGAVTNPVYFTRYNAVQEQSNTNWETSMWGELMYTSYWADDGSSANFAFTDWSVLAGETLYYSDNSSLGLQNCQLFNGSIKAMGSTLVSTNCLYRRVNLSLFNQTSTSYSSNAFFNNLFWQGSIFNQKKAHTWPSCWTFQDNLFDSTSNGVKTIATDICSNNAYVTTNFGTLAYSVNDIVLDSSPAYQSGALGNYYYPASLPLIHAGSRSAAAAGLYYYTVTPDNVIEGANTVSIGYHYVAVGTNGLPLASSDGIPYYQEYPNGPGTGGIGGNSGLQVWITEPMNNSMVP